MIRLIASVCLLAFMVFPCQSEASDAVWSDTLRVSNGSAQCQNPALAVTGDTVWCAWETDLNGNWDIYARALIQGTWSTPLRLTASDSSDLSPFLTRDRQGRLWFIWESRHSGLWKVYARREEGPTMTEERPSPLNSVGSLFPHGAVDRSNGLWIVWQSPGTAAAGNADVFARYYDGSLWTDSLNITEDPSDDCYPQAAVDSTGNAWVVWQSDRSGNDDILATFFDGSSWHDSPMSVAGGPGNDYQPRISVDSQGRVWFAWMSNFNIYSRYYDGEWSAIFQVTFGYYVHQDPAIIGDASADLWTVWVRENGTDDIHGRYYNGDSWSTTDSTAAFDGNDRSPCLAVDELDNLWQVWENDGDIWLRSANIPPASPAAGFEPAGGSLIREERPTILWNVGDEPSTLMQYVLQLDDAAFADGFDFEYATEDGDTSVTVPNPLADNVRWSYRVRTVDPAGLESVWSEIQDFYVDLYAEPPHQPLGLTIEGLLAGEAGTVTPTFVWGYGGDNDPLDMAGLTWYRLHISADAACRDTIQLFNTLPGDTTVTADTLEENHFYFARVQAIVSGEDLPSPWSDILPFRINTRNSGPVVTVLEPNGGEMWSGTQSIRWTAHDVDDDSASLTIAISLSADAGRSWETLPGSDASGDEMSLNDGFYLWDIPPSLRGRDFLIQVHAADDEAGSDDVSDGMFMISTSEIDCQPRLFSPDGDGQDDEVTISFAMSEDCDVHVRIYDLAGRLVRHLAHNEQIDFHEGQNAVTWDGRDEDGSIVPDRLYLVAVTLNDSHGSETRTKTVVVMSR